MALPPTIPTSFVPHPGNTQSTRTRSESMALLNVLSYVLLGAVLVLSLGIFLYGSLLTSSREAKEAELTAAQAAIDPVTIENFVRLHNRLDSSKALLASHPAFSKIFSSFEQILPMKTRFTSLHFAMQEDGNARVDGTGVAQSFNVLAATSNMFATDERLKNVVFSNIRVGKDGTVSFSLSAKIDQKHLVFNPEDVTPPAAPALEVPEPLTP